MESGKTKTRGRVSQDSRNNFWDVTRGISTALPVVKRCGGMWPGMWEGRQPGPSHRPLSLGRIFKYLYTERIHTKPFYNFFLSRCRPSTPTITLTGIGSIEDVTQCNLSEDAEFGVASYYGRKMEIDTKLQSVFRHKENYSKRTSISSFE